MKSDGRQSLFLKPLSIVVFHTLLVGASLGYPDPYIEFVSPNEQAEGEFGWSLSGVPDTNGDGIWEVVIGAPRENPTGSPRYAGRVYLYDGATGRLLHQIVSPNEEIDGLFGFVVSGLSDIDGDGAGDILVGTESEDPGTSPDRAGRAYVFSGSSGEFLKELVSPNEQSAGEFGQSLSGIPDVNGDEIEDFLIGANQEDHDGSPLFAGRAYIFDGSTGLSLKEFVSPHEESEGHFGYAVRGVPDLNGNGSGEALIGSWEGLDNPGYRTGAAYLYDGATGELLMTLVSPDPKSPGYFGAALSWMPDINGNGSVELIVGAPEEEGAPGPAFRGWTYVFDGVTGEVIHALTSPNYALYDHFGYASSVPDLNGDGIADIITGGWDEGTPERRDDPFYREGHAYIFSGSTGAHLRTLESPNRQRHSFFASPINFGMPDTNGDGLGDFLVAAPYEFGDAGRAYLIRSSSDKAQIYVNPSSITFGQRVVDSGPSATETITIRNNGGVDLEFQNSGIEISGNDADDFLLVDFDIGFTTGPSGTTLAPNEELLVSVAFNPKNPEFRTRNAYILVSSNDPNDATEQVFLSGEAVEFLPTNTPTPTPTQTPTVAPTNTATFTATPTATPTPTIDPATVDSDDDGVTDIIEDGGPNGGDGNNDGIPDRNQANVVTLPNAEDGRYVTVVVADGHTLSGVEAVSKNSPPTNPPDGVDHPLGLFDFNIAGVTPGGSATAELILPDEFNPNSYFKYGRQPDNSNPHWYRFMFEGSTGAVIDGSRITLWFIDGDRGDDDLAPNGFIKDPGGPAIQEPLAVMDWNLY
ncbi:MAG: FG-GAP repeat protein [Candidatus Omnitrophica bacterium]|nr:FG-GAP repeat protein [Candidatus Omnitrophota bacterium]